MAGKCYLLEVLREYLLVSCWLTFPESCSDIVNIIGRSNKAYQRLGSWRGNGLTSLWSLAVLRDCTATVGLENAQIWRQQWGIFDKPNGSSSNIAWLKKDDFRKILGQKKIVTVFWWKVPTKLVPAVAVIRVGQVLFNVTGRKGRVRRLFLHL